MIGAILVGFVAGIVARFVIPFDVLRHMHGPKSWGASIAIGVSLGGAGASTAGLGASSPHAARARRNQARVMAR